MFVYAACARSVQELLKTDTLAARTQATSRNTTRSTRVSIQLFVSLICNLNEVTQKTAQQESEQASTEWVQDQIPKKARLSIAASHCFLCHGFAVFNFSSLRLDPDAV